MAGAAPLENHKEQAQHKAGAPRAGFAWPEFWKLFFVGLLGIGMSALALYVFSPITFRTDDELPVGLRSPLRADYSADPANLVVEPLAAHLFADVMIDHAAPGENPAVPLATLVEQMLTPVPAVTAAPGATARPQQTLLPTRTSAPARTATRAVPSVTWTKAAAATLTVAATASPTASATHTVPPVFAATATLTRMPQPTATPTTFRPSATSVTIKTKVPTAVPPTRIPPPPTAKPPAPTPEPPEPPPAYP